MTFPKNFVTIDDTIVGYDRYRYTGVMHHVMSPHSISDNRIIDFLLPDGNVWDEVRRDPNYGIRYPQLTMDRTWFDPGATIARERESRLWLYPLQTREDAEEIHRECMENCTAPWTSIPALGRDCLVQFSNDRDELWFKLAYGDAAVDVCREPWWKDGFWAQMELWPEHIERALRRNGLKENELGRMVEEFARRQFVSRFEVLYAPETRSHRFIAHCIRDAQLMLAVLYPALTEDHFFDYALRT